MPSRSSLAWNPSRAGGVMVAAGHDDVRAGVPQRDERVGQKRVARRRRRRGVEDVTRDDHDVDVVLAHLSVSASSTPRSASSVAWPWNDRPMCQSEVCRIRMLITVCAASDIGRELRGGSTCPLADGCRVTAFLSESAARRTLGRLRRDVSWNMASSPDTAPDRPSSPSSEPDSDALLSGLERPSRHSSHCSLARVEPAAAARILAASFALPYVVHDADPLEHVAAAWVELYEERATLGTLELEVETLLGPVRGPRRGDARLLRRDRARRRSRTPGATGGWACSRTAHRRGCCPSRRSGRRCARGCARCPHRGPGPTSGGCAQVQFDIPDRVGLRDQPGAA